MGRSTPGRFPPRGCRRPGLASAERLAPAAYWADWADALPVMLQRRPDAARRCAPELALGGVSAAPCLRAAAAAGDMLLAEGCVERPEWDSLLRGAQPAPSPPESSEPGVWPHGWQKPAARVLNTSYRERLLCSSPPSSRPGGRACWRVVAGHPHRRRHATPAVGHAIRPQETLSLAAAVGLRRTRQARLQSPG